MRDNTIRSIVLAGAGVLGLMLLSAWLRGTEPSPALVGVLTVGLIATNLLRSFRVPLWRLKRSRWPRRRQTPQPGWWPRRVRQPSWIEGGGTGMPSPFLLASGAMCAAVFAGVFFWPTDPPTLAADYGAPPLANLVAARGPAVSATKPRPMRVDARPTKPMVSDDGLPAGALTATVGTFRCTVTGVHDGDGPIYCAEGPKIRLQAIAARETDETCRPGHPCPAASGAAATAALRRLALGKVLRCEATGTSYSRVTAWCSTAKGVELNCAMVRGGTVAYWRRYDPQGRLCRG